MALEECVANVPRIRIGDIIRQQWIVKGKLGERSCGVVWLVANVRNEKAFAAMKVEPFMETKDDEILKMEVFVLKKMQKSPHFCRLFLAGKMENFNYFIMFIKITQWAFFVKVIVEFVYSAGAKVVAHLRSVLELRMAMPRRRFTTSTCLKIGLQCLEALKEMHTVGFVHRDVKPSNFSFGSTESTKRQIFIFDFGLARQILLPVQGTNELRLREPRKKVAFRGTVRYCSINVHHNMEQGRHDDIISLIYMMIELITGTLPWSGKHKKESCAIKENVSDRILFHVISFQGFCS
ncbi:unnamed protein product [Toxocara canis]|uniref:Protein kinase domain-containing protein n=1 Tax=Toxocara canis TaxID=6265 RepID=A0A183USM1_TOXCA|nr:unnamed protein product [Toxocara canis]